VYRIFPTLLWPYSKSESHGLGPIRGPSVMSPFPAGQQSRLKMLVGRLRESRVSGFKRAVNPVSASLNFS
jgi:hypothetical protein